MRKAILTVALLGLAGNAMAEWTIVAKSSTIVSYADMASIRTSQGTAKMWLLADHVKPSPLGVKSISSVVELDEYDCAEGKARTLQSSGYSGNMRQGEVVFSSDKPTKWVYPQPDSIGAAELKVACARPAP